MAEVIRANGTRETVTPKNGRSFRFVGEAYDLIGTDIIQIVRTNDRRIMLIDEEGKLKDKPINVDASRLYEHGHIDPIVGDVLVCADSEVE